MVLCLYSSSYVSTLSFSLFYILAPIVGQPAQVTLNTSAAGPVPANAIHARVTGPTGKVQDAIVTPAGSGYNLRFNVPEPGPYTIETDVSTLPLRPVEITAIEPIDASKVRAYGPGLSQGTVHKPADFTVDTRGAGNGQLGVTVEGPSESKIDYEDNNDGSCRVIYHPTGSAILFVFVFTFFDNFSSSEKSQLLAITISISYTKGNISPARLFMQPYNLISIHELFVVLVLVLIRTVCTLLSHRMSLPYIIRYLIYLHE